MPKLLADDMNNYPVAGIGNFHFSGVRPDRLGASQYTLVTMAVDRSGSVAGFSKALVDTIKTIVKACQKSPRADNLMLRLITYNQKLAEVHGFVPLGDINLDDYQDLDCSGFTALFDATYSGIGATLSYAKTLIDQDFDVNGVVYIITDGEDNRSTTTPTQISKLMDKAGKSEDIESLISILIGINIAECKESLDDFYKKAKLTQFIDVGDATPQRLAKLAGFVSKSISSVSQSLGTGGKSQSLTF